MGSNKEVNAISYLMVRQLGYKVDTPKGELTKVVTKYGLEWYTNRGYAFNNKKEMRKSCKEYVKNRIGSHPVKLMFPPIIGWLIINLILPSIINKLVEWLLSPKSSDWKAINHVP